MRAEAVAVTERKRVAAEQAAAETAAAVKAAAEFDLKSRRQAESKKEAAEAAEELVEDASWTVRWSLQGQAPFFYNTRTQQGTWLEPAEAVRP